MELDRARIIAQQEMEEQRKLDDIAERERLSTENRAALEAFRRDADIDRAERLREKEAELASQEIDRLAVQNSKAVRVKRASDLLHKSIQAIPRNSEDVPEWFSSFETQLTLNGVEKEILLPLLNQFLTDKQGG